MSALKAYLLLGAMTLTLLAFTLLVRVFAPVPVADPQPVAIPGPTPTMTAEAVAPRAAVLPANWTLRPSAR